MPQRTIDTPIGPVRMVSRDGALCQIRIHADAEPDEAGDRPVLDAAEEQLRAYFAGERWAFDLPLAPAATVRGAALRAAICAIVPGETRSYGTLARITQSGPRAIGQACARNPMPIVVPCHRVVAADGLGHYSGGEGIVTKRWLLAHESRERNNG